MWQRGGRPVRVNEVKSCPKIMSTRFNIAKKLTNLKLLVVDKLRCFQVKMDLSTSLWELNIQDLTESLEQLFLFLCLRSRLFSFPTTTWRERERLRSQYVRSFVRSGIDWEKRKINISRERTFARAAPWKRPVTWKERTHMLHLGQVEAVFKLLWFFH